MTISYQRTSFPNLSRTQFLRHLAPLAQQPGAILLLSGGSRDSAQRSYFGAFPLEEITVTGKGALGENPWDQLSQKVGPLKDDDGLPLWWGHLSYEMGAYAERDKELQLANSAIPDAHFQRCGLVIVFDHLEGEISVRFDESIGHLKQQWDGLLEGEPRWKATPIQAELSKQSDDFESYQEKVQQAREHIIAGDVYQLNLSQEFSFSGSVDPYSLFVDLCDRNPSSFSAYYQGRGYSLVSSSPERFIRRKGHQLEVRPIKGTCPRGQNFAEDTLRREALLSCAKNRAELLMITDLMRNDLSRISEPGSVKTHELYRCEAYQNVYHLLSRIEGTLRPEVSSVDAIRACFPGGSITGCPKLRAMEIIADLEQRPRGIYTGSIGYFAANGDFDFNIAIRTLCVQPEQVSMGVGGAIVYDSDPVSEWNETLHKGHSMFEALGCADEILNGQIREEAWRSCG